MHQLICSKEHSNLKRENSMKALAPSQNQVQTTPEKPKTFCVKTTEHIQLRSPGKLKGMWSDRASDSSALTTNRMRCGQDQLYGSARLLRFLTCSHIPHLRHLSLRCPWPQGEPHSAWGSWNPIPVRDPVRRVFGAHVSRCWEASLCWGGLTQSVRRHQQPIHPSIHRLNERTAPAASSCLSVCVCVSQLYPSSQLCCCLSCCLHSDCASASVLHICCSCSCAFFFLLLMPVSLFPSDPPPCGCFLCSRSRLCALSLSLSPPPPPWLSTLYSLRLCLSPPLNPPSKTAEDTITLHRAPSRRK